MFPRRILITGANGLLGQTLLALMSQMPDYDILATGRDSKPKFPDYSCGYVPLDITNVQDVKQIFLDFAPEIVINAAAMTQVDLCETEREMCWLANVTAVEHLVKACRSSGARLIHLSTDFIFDGVAEIYPENARPNPLSYYGKSKLAAENAVKTLHPDSWAIIRTALVYGTVPNLGRNNIVLWIIQQLQQGKPIQIVTDQWRTPTYVKDLAQGIESIVRFKKNGVYNISGREYLSIFDFAIKVAESLNLDTSLILPTDTTIFVQPAKRPFKTCLLILKAETELEYRPTSIEKAAKEIAFQVNKTLN